MHACYQTTLPDLAVGASTCLQVMLSFLSTLIGCAALSTVDAETDEVPVRSLKLYRNHQGQLYLDGIKPALANRGQVPLGIGGESVPLSREGWTVDRFSANPVQLNVGSKPGVDTMYGSGVLRLSVYLDIEVWTSDLHSAYNRLV